MISSLVGMTQTCVRLSAELILDSPLALAFSGRVQLDPQLLQIRADRRADVHAVLADAAGEYDHVGTPQFDQHRSQIVANAGHEHVERQLCPLVSLGGRFLQIAHVAADSAQAQQSAPLGQIVQELIERFAGPLQQDPQGIGIEIADTVVVRQPTLRAQPHRGCHALTVAYRAQRVGATQVARNQPQVVAPQNLGRPCGDVTMARPVIAKPADIVLLGPFPRHRVVPVPLGNRLVKARFESRHQRHLGQLVAQDSHRRHVGRIVGRRDRAHLFHRRQQRGVDNLHPARSFPPRPP